MSDDLGVLVYYDDYDRVVSMYYVGDRLYNDEYKNGALASQEGSIFVGEDLVYIEYLADGSVERVRIYINDEWYYYYPDGIWEKGVEVLLTPPAGYENADVAYFESIIPTTINCAHENYSEADCENPERCLICGIVKDGSSALGHDMAEATCTSPATCTRCGHTDGEALGHDWIDATYDAPKTCSVCGETEGEPLTAETQSETSDDKNETQGNETQGNETQTQNTENGGGNAGDDNRGEKSGCSSSIGIGAVAIVAIFGAAFVFQKKERE